MGRRVVTPGEYEGRQLKQRHDRHWVTYRMVDTEGEEDATILKVQIGLDSRGRLGVYGLATSDTPITVALVRSLPLARIARDAKREIGLYFDKVAIQTKQAVPDRRLLRHHFDQPRTSDGFLAAVAYTCQEALGRGASTYEAIRGEARAAEQIEPGRETVRRWIDNARKRYEATDDRKFDPGPSRLRASRSTGPKTPGTRRSKTQKGQR